MAEAIVSFVIQKLGNVLIQEAIFLHGVHGQVEQLYNELRRMQCFLKDADSKQQGDERVRNWVAEIRELAYDAEDVVDIFIVKVAFKRGGSIRNSLKNYAFILNKGIYLHNLGKEIKAIFTRIQDISSSRITYGITHVGGEASSSSALLMRRSCPYVEDEDIIGLKGQTEYLVAELIKLDQKHRCVVSIVGVGGLGKTTLAKKVYNHAIVKSNFDCCAWTFVSETCRRRGVLQEILKTVIPSIDHDMLRKMEEEDLVEKIYKFLQQKRYLVVLDDIWRVEDWDVLSLAFPTGEKGSKVLLTTRNKEVASHADPWSLHFEPQYLDKEESWTLFCKKAFPKIKSGVSGARPPGLEKLGKEMVEKCGGLPLAVVVLGGLLSTKKSVNEWETVGRNISFHLDKSQHGVMKILALSYNDLPYHLKPCFLYLGVFPEDFEIETRQLIHLWMAEGFIQQGNEEETKESVGEQQLIELINRCVVQIGKRSLAGGIKTCRLHDFIREMCLLKAEEENFFYHHGIGKSISVVNGSYYNTLESPSFANKLRRCVIHCGATEGENSFKHSIPHLRALFVNQPCQGIEGMYSFSNLKISYEKYRLLRVLVLSDPSLIKRSRYDESRGNALFQTTLPSEIGALVHLRYLGLRGFLMKKLPQSIGNLRNLEILDLGGCFLESLPNSIWKLEQLRHLYAFSFSLVRGGTDGGGGIGNLRNLQTLNRIPAGDWINKNDLVKLTNLCKLAIYDISRSQVMVVLDSIVVNSSNCLLKSLQLMIRVDYSGEYETFPDLGPLSRCNHLKTLKLCGRMKDLPRLFPSSLRKLILENSALVQDPMETLQNLPNLVFLQLNKAYVGKRMICSRQGFPLLQFLLLSNLSETTTYFIDIHIVRGVEEWVVEEGAMPCLRQLMICSCERLRMLPEGLKFVNTLTLLIMTDMREQFNDRVKEGRTGLGQNPTHTLYQDWVINAQVN